MDGGEIADGAAPDGALTRWAEGAIGPFRVTSRFAHDHGYSRLWRLRADAGGAFYWLKCHRYPGKWAGEVFALTRWAPALGLAAPAVRLHRADPPAVLLTEVAGAAAGEAVLTPKAEETLWRGAGAYLARLHTIGNTWFGAANPDGTPQGETHGDAVAFVRRSIESRLAQGTGQGLFDAAEREFIAFGADAWTAALAGQTPRAVHRDYGPRNWMADPGRGALTGVIDFEHARWDVRAADLNRWWDADFLRNPRLADAFFDGYQGGPPDEPLAAQIRALRLLGAAAGVVWATGVGDEPFARRNRGALRRLMREARRAGG